ncbi:hypothetical protein M409DRAFT_63803 [Zasmidium cellare ATCC 36951]|uniref:Uncharacterized protein n=1 Tax=Zasmidium cellare ATCC 36951 TaxID=1080233 RepID=A0A6A6CXX1_ZASCE|nr:uncharacterized protein M409DRAFT_63803 [Zasmidium cellare ATCC 36951]KAF2170722.1 hypothetical protein M409DRAFT_63803 [Zasmidium cellare ATCC 36951]
MPHILGLQLLRLLPLISSTVNVQFANDEYQFLTSWTELPLDKQIPAREVLPNWSTSWQSRGLWQALIGLSVPIIAGVANHVLLRPATAASIFQDPLLSGLDGANVSAARWYLAGSIFSFLHFAFGCKALRLLAQMASDDAKNRKSNIESVAQWLRMHRMRTLLTDLPAFVCFIVATIRQLH